MEYLEWVRSNTKLFKTVSLLTNRIASEMGAYQWTKDKPSLDCALATLVHNGKYFYVSGILTLKDKRCIESDFVIDEKGFVLDLYGWLKNLKVETYQGVIIPTSVVASYNRLKENEKDDLTLVSYYFQIKDQIQK